MCSVHLRVVSQFANSVHGSTRLKQSRTGKIGSPKSCRGVYAMVSLEWCLTNRSLAEKSNMVRSNSSCISFRTVLKSPPSDK
jgi:hypothetical protein